MQANRRARAQGRRKSAVAQDNTHRVVITAMGVICSLGDSPHEIAQSVSKGKTAFARSACRPDMVVAPVEGFDPRAYCGRFKNRRYLNLGAAMAVSAALRAWQAGGLAGSEGLRTGLFVGAGPNVDIGPAGSALAHGSAAEDQLEALWLLRFLPNTAAAVIAERTGIRGENLTVSTACAASLQALGEAFRRVKYGFAPLALAGGGDSRLNPGGLCAYARAKAAYRGDGSAEDVSRPFDRDRKGFVPGEGGAFFLLEQEAHARRRGAAVLAEITGYGASMDGAGMTAPCADGRGAQAAVMAALAEAGMGPEQVDAVSAHGTGTQCNDAVEAAMLARVFDRRKTKVVAFKSWIGHAAAACGAVELALVVSALETGVWPWIRNLSNPCCKGVGWLERGQPLSPDSVLVENFGFGGQNAALVVRRWRS